MTSTQPKLPRVNDTRLFRKPEAAARVDSLARAVLEAVETVSQASLQPVARREAGIAYQPRTLLALLTYAYGLGIYASADIEAMMRADRNFRRLCAGEFPRWQLLRRFRRANADAIRDCLAETFKIISKSDRNQNVYFGVIRSEWMQMVNRQGESWDDVQIAAEVNERLERAVWMDSMAMDDCE
jgi:hypothetical protein